MTPQYKSTKRYQERHRRLGLCVSCSRKAKTGMLRCRVCLERTRLWRMTRHPLFCLECRKLIRPEERTGRSIHKKCVQKRRARTHRLTHRRASLAYQKRHRELGLCHSCSERVFKWGYCGKHYKMEQEKFHRLHAKSKRVSRQQPSVTRVKARSI